MTAHNSDFIKAQNPVYLKALNEIKSGKKVSHFMWFCFPQIRGLSSTPMGNKYAIHSLDQAIAYKDNDILYSRLVEMCMAIDALDKPMVEVFGKIDTMKLKSCMTLFETWIPICSLILQDKFNNERCDKTLDFLVDGLIMRNEMESA